MVDSTPGEEGGYGVVRPSAQGDKRDGEHLDLCVESYGVNTLYMCSQCTTVRYGRKLLGCPVCDCKDFGILKLDEPPEE